MPDFASSQYDRYRRNWFVPVIGTVGIREWWPGQEKFSKIKEGPVVLGVGAAASGLGIVTTRIHGDRDAWMGLCRGLESIGFPSWNLWGEKSYFGELFLLADVIALWGKTACLWDHPLPLDAWTESNHASWLDLGLKSFWIPLILSVVISITLLTLISLAWWNSIRQVRARGLSSMDTQERAWAASQASVLLVHLLFPNILWTIPFALMLIMRTTESWQLKVREIRSL